MCHVSLKGSVDSTSLYDAICLWESNSVGLGGQLLKDFQLSQVSRVLKCPVESRRRCVMLMREEVAKILLGLKRKDPTGQLH